MFQFFIFFFGGGGGYAEHSDSVDRVLDWGSKEC